MTTECTIQRRRHLDLKEWVQHGDKKVIKSVLRQTNVVPEILEEALKN